MQCVVCCMESMKSYSVLYRTNNVIHCVVCCIDVRLNPDLMRSCKKDIHDHCSKELEIVSGQQSEAEGQVMFCLRKQFALKVLNATHDINNISV